MNLAQNESTMPFTLNGPDFLVPTDGGCGTIIPSVEVTDFYDHSQTLDFVSIT